MSAQNEGAATVQIVKQMTSRSRDPPAGSCEHQCLGFVSLLHIRVKIPHNLTYKMNAPTTQNYSMLTHGGDYISAAAAGILSVCPKTVAAVVTDNCGRVHLSSGAADNLCYFDTPTRPFAVAAGRNGFSDYCATRNR